MRISTDEDPEDPSPALGSQPVIPRSPAGFQSTHAMSGVRLLVPSDSIAVNGFVALMWSCVRHHDQAESRISPAKSAAGPRAQQLHLFEEHRYYADGKTMTDLPEYDMSAVMAVAQSALTELPHDQSELTVRASFIMAKLANGSAGIRRSTVRLLMLVGYLLAEQSLGCAMSTTEQAEALGAAWRRAIQLPAAADAGRRSAPEVQVLPELPKLSNAVLADLLMVSSRRVPADMEIPMHTLGRVNMELGSQWAALNRTGGADAKDIITRAAKFIAQTLSQSRSGSSPLQRGSTAPPAGQREFWSGTHSSTTTRGAAERAAFRNRTDVSE